jgi:uncharacterized protein (TIGR03000 family)
MDGRTLRRRGVAALAALLASTTPALAWPWPPAGGWPLGTAAYSGRYDPPPSAYGYRLNENGPSYYGAGNYQENYRTEWGALGWAGFPGPIGNGAPLIRQRPPRHIYEPSPYLYIPTAHLFPEARFTIHCPDDAEVLLEGQKMQQTGCERTFISPPLEPETDYEYTIRARWKDGDRVVEQEKKVILHAGAAFIVRFPLVENVVPPDPDQQDEVRK